LLVIVIQSNVFKGPFSVVDLSDQYELASPNCVAEDFGGEIVAINLDSGRYYSLRGSAFTIFSDLLAGHTPGGIRQHLASLDSDLANAINGFTHRLVLEGLIRKKDSKSVSDEPVKTMPGDLPALEAFDDMADLIKADPIHEADKDTGWPVQPRSKS
jgi:hypothetical protein